MIDIYYHIMSLPQEMINKILYEHKGLQTPSARAMKSLIDQVQENMDNFTENEKDINYFLTMLSNMNGGNGPDSMWCQYLMFVNEFDYNQFKALSWDMKVGYDFSLMDRFPDEWSNAWDDPSILPDDPKDMNYHNSFYYPSFFKPTNMELRNESRFSHLH